MEGCSNGLTLRNTQQQVIPVDVNAVDCFPFEQLCGIGVCVGHDKHIDPVKDLRSFFKQIFGKNQCGLTASGFITMLLCHEHHGWQAGIKPTGAG